ncbi:MAG: PilZ domain-containing protein [Hyphomicrobiales bacterium]|nr:PilZ domain-containing protein [Hyphomicrobiales bacterium]MCP5372984.1 PilZ domain-containing protein [Hyphomicrobiales bacterium]
MADSLEGRAYARWLIGEAGTVRVGDAAVPCTVVNVSAGGMLLRTAARGEAGDRVAVALAGLLPFDARVVRTGDGEMAVAFDGGPQYVFR